MNTPSAVKAATIGAQFSIEMSLDAVSESTLREQAARHLCLLAERIEAGEALGEIRDRNGIEIGWFDMSLDEF